MGRQPIRKDVPSQRQRLDQKRRIDGMWRNAGRHLGWMRCSVPEQKRAEGFAEPQIAGKDCRSQTQSHVVSGLLCLEEHQAKTGDDDEQAKFEVLPPA